MLKKILKLNLLSLLVLLTNCAVTPPDIPVCTEINPTKGFCVTTISSKQFEITDTKKYKNKTWWELRPYFIKMPTESWVEIKKFIIKVCKKHKCKNSSISSWERTVKTIDEKIAN